MIFHFRYWKYRILFLKHLRRIAQASVLIYLNVFKGNKTLVDKVHWKEWTVVLNFGISISFRKQRFFSSQFIITPIPHPFSIYFENDALTNETMTLTLDLHYFKLSFSSQQPVRKELRTFSNSFYLKFSIDHAFHLIYGVLWSLK